MPKQLSFEQLEQFAEFLFATETQSIILDYEFKNLLKEWSSKQKDAEHSLPDDYNDYLFNIFRVATNINIIFSKLEGDRQWLKVAFMFWLAYVDEILKGNPNERVDPEQMLYAWESFKNIVNIFITPDKAQQFLNSYISSKEKTLRIERLLEWGLRDEIKTKQYMSLIRHISSDIDLITSDQYRNKFRTVTLYYAEIMQLKPDENGKFDEELLNKFAENAYNDLVAANLAKETKPTFTEDQKQKFKEKFKREYKDKLKDKLQKLFDGKLSAKDSLNACLEIAQLIARANAKILSPKQAEMLFKMGVGPSGFSQLAKLKQKSHDTMPDAIIQLDGYYICKMSPQDIRGPFLGLATGCCQHLEGVGTTAAIYGYTQENSCFYVMFKGKAPTKIPIDTREITDPIVAQSWAWKSDDAPEVIVFDSIEASGLDGSESSKGKERKIREGFYELAKAIVQDSNNHVQQVRSGNGGTVVSPHTWLVTKLHTRTNEDDTQNMVPVPKIDDKEQVYSDAEQQGTLYDRRLTNLIELNIKLGFDMTHLIYCMGLDTNNFFETCLKNGCDIEDAIKGTPNITTNMKDFLLNLLDPNANSKTLLVDLLRNKELIFEIPANGNIRDIVQLFVAAGADVNAIDKDGNSAFLLLIQIGHIDTARELLPEVHDVNILNNSGLTPLLAALSLKPHYGFQKKTSLVGMFILGLLHSGAKVDTRVLAVAEEKLAQAKKSLDDKRTQYDIIRKEAWVEELTKIIEVMETRLDPKARISSPT